MQVKLDVSTTLKRTPRIMMLEGMFDVPPNKKLSHHWEGDVPLDARDWNVGLIVGPSGAGKSSLLREMFDEPRPFKWSTASCVDDFPKALTIQQITDACSAVGFNSIPSWMKSFGVLSTGEKFRVELARALLERPDPVVVDEFTSVVDRQVAKIGAHAVQKLVRKQKRKFVAATCHFDVIDWLQPDWVLEPVGMKFTWRMPRRRPSLDFEVTRVEHEAWELFAPFHYLTAELSKAAICYGGFVDGRLASFAGVLHLPHAQVDDVKRVSRLVTLPDYQGLGLAFSLVDTLGSAYRALNYRLRTYPAHPSLVRAFDRSDKWRLCKEPGGYSPARGATSRVAAFGGRPCAVFEFTGERMKSKEQARSLIDAKA